MTAADLPQLLARHWGLVDVTITGLGSYEDENHLVTAADGRRYLLKRERGRTEASLGLEHAALARLAAAPPPPGVEPTLALPDPLPVASGAGWLSLGDERLRLLTWVPGTALADRPRLGDRVLGAIGGLAAWTGESLRGLEATVPDSKWDPRHAAAVVAGVLNGTDADADTDVSDVERIALAAALAPLAADPPQMPLQVIHGDVTDHNTVAPAGDGAPTGLIDFSDVCVSWRIAELAAAAVAVACRAPGDPLPALLTVLAGYHAVAPLNETEADALWAVVLARAGLCAGLSLRQRSLAPGSAYVTTMAAGDWAGLHGLLAIPAGLAVAAIRDACGYPPVRRSNRSPTTPVPVIDPPPTRTLDLSVGSPDLRDGEWLDPARLNPRLRELSDGGALGRWGEVRLTATAAPGDEPPATLHLGADVYAAAGTPVRAPLPATVHAVERGELTLRLKPPAPASHLRIAGVTPVVAPGASVHPGDPLGTIADTRGDRVAHLHLQYAPGPGTPGLGDPRLRAAWLALCPDPSALVGADVRAPAPPDPASELARRTRVLAGAQELYYERPLPTVRGDRQYLYDAHGRAYLDMVNNVASIGHSHPRVTAAAARQFALLNTNSRFLYDSMTTYAERLAALLPEPLDTVFLVNSGSEACDLALQIARAATGRRDVVALQGAYHGWTGNVYDACTSPADNPLWQETAPPWVHLAAQPDPYRGRFGANAGAYAASVADACAAAVQRPGGSGPGAFIAETMLGNQGAVELPSGYLAAAYAAVRAAGGVCVADEIQVGFARTGESFWAFQHEGVVPDIVATAKAAGNGHPIGAVICRRELADALGRRAAFFSSTGGSPVSCEIGIAVLDVIAEERLQENARRLGARARSALLGLADRHAAIGAVHGRGLYLGVDLVVDRATRAPDRPRALAVSQRLRELGIVVQPTGDAGNVLKVKPPLCLSGADVDRFVDRLDRALGELG